jgi:hypothetical protein
MTIRNESIPVETMVIWIKEFENMQLTTEQVELMIKKTAKKKIFGSTKFSDFLEENESYTDVDIIRKKTNEGIWKILGFYGYTPEGYRNDYNNKLITESLQKENEKLNQKLLTDGDNSQNQIRQAKLLLLLDLSGKIPAHEYTALKIIKKEIENLKQMF